MICNNVKVCKSELLVNLHLVVRILRKLHVVLLAVEVIAVKSYHAQILKVTKKLDES